MTPAALVTRIVAEVPAFDPELLDDETPADTPYHVVDLLARWLIDEPDPDDARPAYAAIEDGFVHGDEDVNTLLSLQLFDGLGWPDAALEQMGPATRHRAWLHTEGATVAEMARLLRRGRALEPYIDPAFLLHGLGAEGAREHRALVERYVEDADSTAAIAAVRVLCLYWDDPAEHEPLVVRAVREGLGERREAARLEAVEMAGPLTRNHDLPALRAELERIVADPAEDAALRRAARASLTPLPVDRTHG